MPEKISEQHFKDISKPESENAGLGLELIPGPAAEQVRNEIGKIQESLAENQPVQIQQLLDLDEAMGNFMVDVGGEQVPLKQLKDIPNIKQNVTYNKNIEAGWVPDLVSVEFLTEKAAKIAVAEKNFAGESLWLPKLVILSPKVARVFGEEFIGSKDDDSKSSIHITGLRQTSDDSMELLSKTKAKILDLYGLSELTDEQARSLGKYEGLLILDGLGTLSETAAENLGNHQGALLLNGLSTISDRVAESLSRQKGDLQLEGLTYLSDRSAEFLSHHTVGTISFKNRKISISPTAKNYLADTSIFFFLN